MSTMSANPTVNQVPTGTAQASNPMKKEETQLEKQDGIISRIFSNIMDAFKYMFSLAGEILYSPVYLYRRVTTWMSGAPDVNNTPSLTPGNQIRSQPDEEKAGCLSVKWKKPLIALFWITLIGSGICAAAYNNLGGSVENNTTNSTISAELPVNNATVTENLNELVANNTLTTNSSIVDTIINNSTSAIKV